MDKTLNINIKGHLGSKIADLLEKRLNKNLEECAKDEGSYSEIAVRFDITSYDYSSALRLVEVLDGHMKSAKFLNKECTVYLDGLTREYLTQIKRDPFLNEAGLKLFAENVLLYDQNRTKPVPMPQVVEVPQPTTGIEATMNYINSRLSEPALKRT